MRRAALLISGTCRALVACRWHLGSLDAGAKDGTDGNLPQMSPLDAGYGEFVSTPQCGCSTNTNCGCLHPLSQCSTGHYNGSAHHMVFPCQQYFLGGPAAALAAAAPAGPPPPATAAFDSSIIPFGGGTKQTPDDDAQFLLDSFENFLNRSLAASRPFLACIHFHNVHIPCPRPPPRLAGCLKGWKTISLWLSVADVATEPFRALYPAATSNEKDYFGGLTMMDAAIGRLRALLRSRGIAENTAVFFGTGKTRPQQLTSRSISFRERPCQMCCPTADVACTLADNGPEVGAPPDPKHPGMFPVAGWPFFPDPGVTGRDRPNGLPHLRGRKRDLTEGGIRVPGLVEWPALIKGPPGRAVHWPAATFDYLPTVLGALGVESDNKGWPLDGIDLRPLLSGELHTRSAAAAAAVATRSGSGGGGGGIGGMGWQFKTPFGKTNSADPLKCPPAANSSLVVMSAAPPTVLPSMPSSFAALQVAWAEDGLKLFGCRDKGTEGWRMFLYNISASDWEAGETDILAHNLPLAKQMVGRMTAWQHSVQVSQTAAETNCSGKWAL